MEIELSALLNALKKLFWVPLLLVIVFGVAGYTLADRQVRMFTATSTIVLEQSVISSAANASASRFPSQLPKVDDGAVSLEETGAMFSGLATLGYTQVVATPHWAVGMPNLPESVISGPMELAAKSGVQLSIARECRIHPNLLEHVELNPSLRIDGGNVVLVELPWGSSPMFTVSVFQSLVRNGFRPILAHAERHGNLWEPGSPLEQLFRLGVAIQMNIQSLTGQHGKGSRERAISLLEQGMVSLVASDMHSAAELESSIPNALMTLNKLVGSEVASLLTTHNPAALLRNEPIEKMGMVHVDTSLVASDDGIASQLKRLGRKLPGFLSR